MENLIITRYQEDIDAFGRLLDKTIQLTQAVIDTFNGLGIGTFEYEDLSAALFVDDFLRQATIAYLCRDGRPSVGGFPLTDEGLMQFLQFPDFTPCQQAIDNLARHVLRDQKNNETLLYFQIVEGVACRIESKWEQFVRSKTVYANTPERHELWAEINQVEASIKRWEAFKESRKMTVPGSLQTVAGLLNPVAQFLTLYNQLRPDITPK